MKQWELDTESKLELDEKKQTPENNASFSASIGEIENINKLIFVQDFVNAQIALKKLVAKEPNSYEAYFRLIEVAWKTGSLQDLIKELTETSQKAPENLAALMALTLAEIRMLEQKASESQGNTAEIINPNFGRGENNLNDVIGLSANNEIISYLPSGKPLLTDESVFKGIPSESAFRVSRHPTVADDHFVNDNPNPPENWAEMVNENGAENAGEHRYQPPCIMRAKNFPIQYPDNYAGWFLAGCAMEYNGNLSDAISYWNKAKNLEAKSISVLSTMAELQQIGVIPIADVDYSQEFENLDRFLVHGSLESHVLLYQEYMSKNEYDHAVAALRTLADWMQKQRGEVPSEIEALCLLGARKAYEKSGNVAAAEACKHEAESLIMATRAAPTSSGQLKFLGEICQEFGLELLAKSCYASALTMQEVSPQEIVQIVSQCSAIGCNETIEEALKIAYRTHRGAPEIRFAQVICSTSIAKVSTKAYTERKNKIRELIQNGDLATAFGLLQEALGEITDDAEIYYYLGEILSRFGADSQALNYFQKMQQLDPYNSESLIRFCHFLFRIGTYNRAFEIAENALTNTWISEHNKAEFHWIAAKCYFEQKEFDEALKSIRAALQKNPWNITYISLEMELIKPADESHFLGIETLSKEFEEIFIKRMHSTLSINFDKWIEIGEKLVRAGYNEYAYCMARCLFLLGAEEEKVKDFFVKAASSINSRQVVQQILLLLQAQAGSRITLTQIAICVAKIYALDGEWELSSEWIDISIKNGIENKRDRAKLLELQALMCCLQGKESKKALSLLEAAIDVFESERSMLPETHLLHAFLLSTQGEKKRAFEKVESYLSATPSIVCLYFAYKTLVWCEASEKIISTVLTTIFEKQPINRFEQKLLDDIFCIAGKKNTGASISIAC